MNLIDLITRKDNYLLSKGHGLTPDQYVWHDVVWRSVKIVPSGVPQLEFANLSNIYALQAMPGEIGWYVRARQGRLIVVLENSERRSERCITLGDQPVPVPLPWDHTPGSLNPGTRLSLHFELPDNETAQLLVHRKLNRELVIRLAQGTGVEIGPGANPQIHPGETVSVAYVEETPAEKWAELYDKQGQYNSAAADFSRYVIGTAWDLPVADRSLDFVFSSHVFEHLVNPIGHLLQWKQKLRSGGKVIAVVPDPRATKDYLMPPDSLEEMLDEYRRGITVPELRHYRRFGVARRNTAMAEKWQANKFSIHVHFYTPDSMAQLLGYCVREQGFRAYSIAQSLNHKDFYFVLEV